MLSKRIFANILNVNAKIENIQTIGSKHDIVISVRPYKKDRLCCPICNHKSQYYDNGRGIRLWRSCDWNNHLVHIAANAPRIKCKKHGVLVAKVPWTRHGSGFTYEFEQMVAYKAINGSKKSVSQEMRISWQTVGEIVSRVKKSIDTNPTRRFDNLRAIGIDETSYQKGHKYITVVVNHDTGKAIWISLDYGKEVLASFFEQLTKEQRESIKYVTADGAKWIASCIEEYCPQAERCMDSFHVVTWATDVLDDLRKQSWHEAKKSVHKTKRKRGRPRKTDKPNEDIAKIKKANKYALGKAPEHLTVTQTAQLQTIQLTDKRLYRGYCWKERLRLIFQMKYEDATLELNRWLKGIKHCRIPSFIELGEKIQRHKDAILATIKYGLSNARIEAINNKIKLTIRMAYGFRNMDNMLDMIMLRCSDLNVPLPWETLI